VVRMEPMTRVTKEARESKSGGQSFVSWLGLAPLVVAVGRVGQT